ncbi:MAG: hypothetical protein IGS49_00680 [Chlorogloeopsis fritschii C42_A2020_084]|uniref:hypothetical protein n=1 Tax=Chlorogloeopsis fritschii TaxID=1124 RepID=UPI0019DB3EF8|nr:hypothetical protein [Chlorogloeopsis fritschii]MBF2004015.1 hypothetical protein [Chlorogloeopsis fritschii C42_A2020_084]
MMVVNYRQLKKLVLHSVALGLVVAGAIACQPESPIVSSSPASAASNREVSQSKPSTPKPVPQNKAIYKSDRFGFQFSYPSNIFVVDDKTKIPSSNNAPLAAIQIWTQEHAKKIGSGAYEGGTEYPANVSVTVANNPQKLPLQKWVKQSNQFGVTRAFKDTKIAGQNAIAFQSSGLYENEHVVFTSPNGSNIIVITFGKTGYGNNDAIYQKAFDQVVNSFTFLRG